MANYKSPGRPPNQLKLPQEEVQTKPENNVKESEVSKVGTFISLNTVNVKGLRLNLDKVFSYAPNGDTAIQFAQGDGNQTTLSFGSKEDMLKALEQIDSRCQ